MKKAILIIFAALLTIASFAQENFGGVATSESSLATDKFIIERGDGSANFVIMKKYLYDRDTLYLEYGDVYMISDGGDLTIEGSSIDLSAPVKYNGTLITANGAELNILDGALFSTAGGNYLVGVTSAIQTQLNSKLDITDTTLMLDPYLTTDEIAGLYAPLASPTFTGTVTIPSPFTLGSTSVTATGTELNYVGGVTGGIQTQLDSKAPLASPDFTGNINIAPRSEPLSTDEGDIYYDSDVDSLYLRVNGSWVALNREAGGGGSMVYPGEGIPLSTGSGWGTSITNNSVNWNTAYSWGDHTGLYDAAGTASGLISTHEGTYNHSLVAATGRTSLGGTTIGQNMFTLTNPSAVTFPRFNADNTVTARSATELKTDLSLENVSNESKSTMFSSPTFTGTVTIPSPFTLGSTSVTANGSELNVLDNMTATTTQLNYLNAATGTTGTTTSNLVFSASPTFTGTLSASNINIGDGGVVSKWVLTDSDGICALDQAGDTCYYDNPMSAKVDLDTVMYVLTDTIPLYGAVLGVGNTADTAAFALNNKIWAQRIDGSHNIVITKVWAVAQGTSPDIDIALLYASDYSSGSPTAVMSADLTVTSTSTGNSTTSFSNATIAPGNWLWIRVDQATTKPTQLIISIFGYRTEIE